MPHASNYEATMEGLEAKVEACTTGNAPGRLGRFGSLFFDGSNVACAAREHREPARPPYWPLAPTNSRKPKGLSAPMRWGPS